MDDDIVDQMIRAVETSDAAVINLPEYNILTGTPLPLEDPHEGMFWIDGEQDQVQQFNDLEVAASITDPGILSSLYDGATLADYAQHQPSHHQQKRRSYQKKQHIDCRREMMQGNPKKMCNSCKKTLQRQTRRIISHITGNPETKTVCTTVLRGWRTGLHQDQREVRKQVRDFLNTHETWGQLQEVLGGGLSEGKFKDWMLPTLRNELNVEFEMESKKKQEELQNAAEDITLKLQVSKDIDNLQFPKSATH